MDVNVPKSRLGNITMYVERLKFLQNRKLTQFTWDLAGFFRSKNSAVFTKKVEELDIHFKVTKNRAFFTVSVDPISESPVNIFCRALSGDDYASDFFHVRQVSEHLYEVIFPPSEVKSLKDCSLSNCGSIKLQFSTVVKAKCWIYPGGRCQDFSRFAEFKYSGFLLKPLLADFAIQPAWGPKLYCPRSLLAARSNFFRNYFNEPSNNRNEMSIIAPLNSLYILIYYLYSGKLYASDLRVMLDIVKLAWDLDILSLKRRCAHCFPSFITLDNVLEIKREGKETGLSFLVENADDFLANVGSITA